MAKQNKIAPRYKIGDWVSFGEHCKVEYDDRGRRVLKTTKAIRCGQVCGLRRVHLGEYHQGSNKHSYSYGGDDDYNPSYLIVTQTVLLYEVRIGMLNRPYLVLEESLEPAVGSKSGVPLLGLSNCVWDEQARRSLRDEMKDWPRDAKGHWVKHTVQPS